MAIKIVADSSCDLTEDMKNELNIELVPLSLQLEDKVYVDNEDLDLKEYIKAMKECPTSPKTACPSPQDFLNAYEGDDDIFGVTLSQELSGTYNSAVLAKNIYLDENKEKFIHIFNSKGASSSETLVSLKINELAKKGLDNLKIVEEVEQYISEIQTFFLLESLDHLAKAGRLKPFIAKIASLFSIKPIMGSTEEGTIRLVEKVRGYKKAFRKFVEIIGKEGKDLEEKVLAIAHCNCPERAQNFKEEVEKQYNFKDIVIVEMAGLSSTYADDGGLVIAF